MQPRGARDRIAGGGRRIRAVGARDFPRAIVLGNGRRLMALCRCRSNRTRWIGRAGESAPRDTRVVLPQEFRQFSDRPFGRNDRRAAGIAATSAGFNALQHDRRTRSSRSCRVKLCTVGLGSLFVGNHIVDFQDPRHATGIVYCHGWIDDGGPWIEQAIQYHDQYELRDGQWLFVRRKHLLVYGQTQTEHPLAQPQANWPENQVGRGSLPESEASWQAFWADRTFPGRSA